VTRARSSVYVWVTWLSKLMAGESNCQWSAWFKSHHTEYARVPGNFQLAAWTTEHTQLLDEVSKERVSQGEIVYREGQNSFRAKRKSGLTVAGTPDLISMEQESGRCFVYDVKTGTPRQSDIVQVALYMMFLPYATGLYKGKKLDGYVVYKTGKSEVPYKIIDEKFQKNVTYFLNILESSDPPPRLPTHAGCLWCDLTATDCHERIESADDNLDENCEEFPL
jgi:PD-(D/E)XK nuclease superfamily